MNLSTLIAEPDIREDAELMCAFCSGDKRAFDILYNRYNHNLVGRLYAVCGDIQHAEDAAQETWHIIVARSSSYNPPTGSRFRGWLFAIGYRKAVSAWRLSRREKVCPQVEQEFSDQSAEVDPLEPISELIRRESAERLRMAISQLEPHYRMTVLLYYFEEYKVSTIAEILGIAELTVYTRLYAARKRLLSLLGVPEP